MHLVSIDHEVLQLLESPGTVSYRYVSQSELQQRLALLEGFQDIGKLISHFD